jgi:conjugal transfer pilus assembly protein TraW
MKKLLLLLILFAQTGSTNHIGTFGQTFSIAEEDLVESIQNKLKILEDSGAIAEHQANIQKSTIEKIQRPNPVNGLIKTQKPRTFLYDPSIQVPYDLKDHKGQVFIKAGTIVNPLDLHAFNKILIFINGDDPTQVAWAINKNSGNTKIILINGSPFELMKQHLKTFYFDQTGKIVKKFGINQVPARVSQQESMLLVEEILLEND